MATDIDYALLSANAYFSQRDPVNRIGIPKNWTLIERIPIAASGFEAAAYRNGSEIVIAFTGTDQMKDWATNIPAGFGAWSTSQMRQAAAFYQKIKSENSGTISFTGHSLGGGLAALMGVFFNKTAVTFDPAPFRQSASNSSRDTIKAYLSSIGYGPDADLDAFVSDVDFIPSPDTPNLSQRELLVRGISVADEILSDAIALPGYRIGNQEPPLRHGSEDFDSISLHSIALLTAFLQEGDFRLVTNALPNLIPLIFDKKLFAFDTSLDSRNFMDFLVRHQAGTDAMLTHFTADMQRITATGKATDEYKLLNEALIAFGIQAYYQQDAGFTSEFFQDETGGVSFDRDRLDASLGNIKGYAYFKTFLEQYYTSVTTDLTSASIVTVSPAKDLILAALPEMRDWTIQAGADALNATDTHNWGAFMFGSNGEDILTGGTGNDLLAGNGGTDTLPTDIDPGADGIQAAGDAQGNPRKRAAANDEAIHVGRNAA